MPTKFDFVSPGIQLNEVDESQIPSVVSDDIGPLIIGRSLSGPAMKPIKVKTLDDFNEIFGKGISGKGSGNNDVWRDGNTLGPTYGVYAAQAHLASQTTPITFVRLLGEKSSDAETDAQYAGWNIAASSAPSATPSSNKSAYGLFIAPTGSDQTGTLAAIFYIDGGGIALSGTAVRTGLMTSSAGTLINSLGTTANRFAIDILDSNGIVSETKTFDFTPGSANYIRNQFNTNPQMLEGNKNFGLTDKNYFLGETFEESVLRYGGSTATAGAQAAIILSLNSGSLNFGDHKKDMLPSKTGWFINRRNALGRTGEKLFRLVAIHDGEWLQNNYDVVIKDLSLGNDLVPNSTFTVEIQDKEGNAIEQFSGLNLDPSSNKYISKVIGDQYQVWDSANLKYNVRGEYTNKSNYVYVEVSDAVKYSKLEDAYALPVGFYGPLRPKGFTLEYGSSGANVLGGTSNAGTAASVLISYTGAMSNSDKLVITHPRLGDFTINFASGAGAAPTVFTSQAATINIGTTDDAQKTGDAVKALLDTIPDYTATSASAGITLTGDTPGPFFSIVSDETDTGTKQFIGHLTASTDTDNNLIVSVGGGATMPRSPADFASDIFADVPQGYTGKFVFPALRLTAENTNSDGRNYTKNNIFGVRHHRGTATTRDGSYIDLVRTLPSNATITLSHHLAEGASLPDSHEYSFIFTLDDVKQDSVNTNTYYFESGSYDLGTSYSKAGGNGTIKDLFDNKIRQFRAPLFGGHDGLDLKEVEPFSNKNLADKNRKTYYGYNSIFKAMESVADPESVKYNVLSIPGVTRTDITDEVLRNAGDRKDHLAIIDIEGGHKPGYENNGSVTTGLLSTTITSLEGRKINNSYAATYYPWVRLKDRLGGNGDALYVPPSVAAIGALAKSQGDSELWFAPAGFNRGGINELGGPNGPMITGTWEHLTKDDRDDLYKSNINPIARFPSMNQIVIFGQKTLQQESSALDRINVRRLLIHLKYRIGLIADTILFDQNVNTTWNRFKFQAERVLSSVQSRLGISEYKLVLDKKTTTADLVDRNIMYAKIFIKPTRSIEFIAVDFIISRSGVEF